MGLLLPFLHAALHPARGGSQLLPRSSFLGVSPSREGALLGAFDPAYSAISALVTADPRVKNLTAPELGELVRKVVVRAFDPDSQGSHFAFHHGQQCPECASEQTVLVHETPTPWTEREVHEATHSQWDALTDVEKAAAVEEALTGSLR
ncbi:hypothetical protein [Streptomyces sp. H39-S7]|uniref:hypothetical protein n=1 Tax=Streptomyces sp. H39-S7 TaxID=3004357 RepID=UPI0022B03295|nr:hypothetical protein [Streptomyces sp. H39-S7]MCZ4124679.1 hypothetical protein [Streptomyces sp. H39-S7]